MAAVRPKPRPPPAVDLSPRSKVYLEGHAKDALRTIVPHVGGEPQPQKDQIDVTSWRRDLLDLGRVMNAAQALWLLFHHYQELEAVLRVALEIIICQKSRKVLWWNEGWLSDVDQKEWFQGIVLEKLAAAVGLAKDQLDGPDEGDKVDAAVVAELQKSRAALEERLKSAIADAQMAEMRASEAERERAEAVEKMAGLESAKSTLQEQVRKLQDDLQASADQKSEFDRKLAETEKKLRDREEENKIISQRLKDAEVKLADSVPKSALNDMVSKDELNKLQAAAKATEKAHLDEIEKLKKKLAEPPPDDGKDMKIAGLLEQLKKMAVNEKALKAQLEEQAAEIGQLKESEDALRAEVQGARDELQQARDEIVGLQSSLEEAKLSGAGSEDLRAELDDALQALKDAQKEAEDLRTSESKLHDEMATLKLDCAKVYKRLDEALKAQKAAEQRAEAAEEEARTAKEDAAVARTETSAATRAAEQAVADLQKAEKAGGAASAKAIAELEERLAAAEAATAAAKEKAKEEKALRLQAEEAREAAEAAKEAAEKAARKAEERAKKAAEQAGAGGDELNELKAKMKEMQQENKQLKEDNEAKDAKIAKQKEKLKELATENEGLLEKQEHLMKLLNDVRKQMDKVTELAQQKGLGDVVKDLMTESGLADTMLNPEFTAFDRLYQDALRRQKKQKEQYMDKFGDNMSSVVAARRAANVWRRGAGNIQEGEPARPILSSSGQREHQGGGQRSAHQEGGQLLDHGRDSDTEDDSPRRGRSVERSPGLSRQSSRHLSREASRQGSPSSRMPAQDDGRRPLSSTIAGGGNMAVHRSVLSRGMSVAFEMQQQSQEAHQGSRFSRAFTLSDPPPMPHPDKPMSATFPGAGTEGTRGSRADKRKSAHRNLASSGPAMGRRRGNDAEMDFFMFAEGRNFGTDPRTPESRSTSPPRSSQYTGVPGVHLDSRERHQGNVSNMMEVQGSTCLSQGMSIMSTLAPSDSREVSPTSSHRTPIDSPQASVSLDADRSLRSGLRTLRGHGLGGGLNLGPTVRAGATALEPRPGGQRSRDQSPAPGVSGPVTGANLGIGAGPILISGIGGGLPVDPGAPQVRRRSQSPGDQRRSPQVIRGRVHSGERPETPEFREFLFAPPAGHQVRRRNPSTYSGRVVSSRSPSHSPERYMQNLAMGLGDGLGSGIQAPAMAVRGLPGKVGARLAQSRSAPDGLPLLVQRSPSPEAGRSPYVEGHVDVRLMPSRSPLALGHGTIDLPGGSPMSKVGIKQRQRVKKPLARGGWIGGNAGSKQKLSSYTVLPFVGGGSSLMQVAPTRAASTPPQGATSK